MKTKPQQPADADALTAKNETVMNAYKAIIAEVNTLMPQFSRDYLRTFTEVDYSGMSLNCLYAFYSPLIHLRLEMVDGISTIYFARSYSFKEQLGYQLDSLLTRCVYWHTSKAVTAIDIEDTLNVSLYNADDYKQTKNLIAMGFKGAVKHTLKAKMTEAY